MIKILSGDMDNDSFLTENDMPENNWNMLLGCSHQGKCDEDVKEAVKVFDIADYDKALRYIVDCGLDEDDFLELYDFGDEESLLVNNEERILEYYLWLLAGNIKDNNKEVENG